MSELIYPPTTNAPQKQLNANFTSGGTVLTLNNTTNIQNKPGVCVVNRIDTNGTRLSSSLRTYYKFTGTSGATLTGCTAVDGNDQDHAIGQVVEFIPDVVWAQALNDVITTEHNTDGTHKETALDSMIAGTEAAGDIIYHNGTIWTRLPAGSNTNVLTLAAGVPTWAAASAGGASFWTDVPGTPTRVSDTQFTITDTSNANLYDQIFKRGVLLRWLESSTFQVAMVISSSYGANTVTVNLVGDSLTAGFTSMKYCLHMAQREQFIIAGTFPSSATTDLSRTLYLPEDHYILSADLYVKTAGSGTGSTVVDINVSGTTKFTTKPTLTTTGTSDLDNVADTPSTLCAKDAPITVDVDSVTATTAPTDGYVYIYMMPVSWRYRS